MTTDQHPTGTGESPDSPDQVLAALHTSHLVVNQAEVDKLRLAVQWAICHPVESLDDAATVDGTEGELAIAGDGCTAGGGVLCRRPRARVGDVHRCRSDLPG